LTRPLDVNFHYITSVHNQVSGGEINAQVHKDLAMGRSKDLRHERI
jgi:hypothetical protein